MDFSKAFNKVSFERLCKKLESHGTGDKILSWIKNWLSNRRQRVCIDGEFSEWVRVTSGVTQWSVLGPLLFIVYINDLDSNIISKFDKFADDSNLGKSISTQQEQHMPEKNLENLQTWSNDWQMRFNAD